MLITNCNSQVRIGTAFTTSATHIPFFQGSNIQSEIQLARHFALVNNATRNSGFDAAVASIAAITPHKGPVVTGLNTK